VPAGNGCARIVILFETIVTRRRHALLLLHVMKLAPRKPEAARQEEYRRLVMGPDWAQLPSRHELRADTRLRKRLRPELHLRDRQKRLMHLIFQTTDTAWDGTGTAPGDLRRVRKLEDVVAEHLPQWAAGLPDVVVIPRDSWGGDAIVQRCQKFGSCYMQSADVLAHYIIRRNLFALNGTAAGVFTADLTTYMLRRVKRKAVWSFIDEDLGGNTLPFLRNLAGLNDAADIIIKKMSVDYDAPVADSDIVRLLQKYGPAVVSTMDMHDTMATQPVREPLAHPAIFAYAGDCPVQYPVKLWHSVLVIGYRTEPAATPGGVSAGTRYLIQNWWDSKQFFEVDLAFLKSRQAELAWVTNSNLTALPAGTVLCNGLISASMPFGRASCPDPRTRGR
jgi:hypothetical protein